jgi:hypothetical protein
LWYHPQGQLLDDGQAELIHNVKGVYHDIIEGKRGRLLLGRRRLDIEAYNGLTELPTFEQITPMTSRLTIVPTEGTEPDILSPLSEEEDFPSVLQIFEAIDQAADESVLRLYRAVGGLDEAQWAGVKSFGVGPGVTPGLVSGVE